jgi:hypothetical protein
MTASYKITVPVIYNWWETSSLTLREVHTLRVYENKGLRIIFLPTKEGVAVYRKLLNYKMSTLHLMLGWLNQRDSGCMACIMNGKIHITFWWET